MFYHEYPPPPALRPYIQCFWMLEHDYRQPIHNHEHLWADTHVECIFSFGERYYLRPTAETTKPAAKSKLPENFLIGPLTKQLLLYSNGITGLIAARFHPWGFAAFSSRRQTTLLDATLPLNDTLLPGIKTLAHQLRSESREKKLQLLTAWFLDNLPTPNPGLETVRSIATAIQADHGRQRIAKLCAQFNISLRKFERQFLRHVGLPPKAYARIHRFSYAKDLLLKNPDISLAALSYEAGYADQAHFSRNFKQLFDLTPAQFKTRIKKFHSETSGTDHHVVFVQDQNNPAPYI